MLPPEAHTKAPLLNYMSERGVHIVIPWEMNKLDIEKALNYRTHSSAQKEKAFVIKYLVYQLRAGHVDLFP